jgi:predicted fused transcriptional regulator/phosphomethylpyrimidine kinase
MHNIYSIFNTEYEHVYDLCFEEYLLQRYGNTNKESVVEKVTDILSSFCEEKSLLALQKMKEFQDVVSRGWEGQILKKIGDMEISSQIAYGNSSKMANSVVKGAIDH